MSIHKHEQFLSFDLNSNGYYQFNAIEMEVTIYAVLIDHKIYKVG